MLHDLLSSLSNLMLGFTKVDLGEGAQGAHPFPSPPPKMSSGFLKQLVFLKKFYVVYWTGVEVKLACTQMLFYFSFRPF